MIPRAVIFDMDGVLCHLDDTERLTFLSNLSGQSVGAIRYAIWTSGFEDQADEGKYSAAEYLKEFGKRIGYPISREEWTAYRRSGMITIPESLQIARRLAGRTKLAVLTNNGLLLKELICSLFPELPEIFGENIFVSAELRFSKPNDEAFLSVCERLHTPPQSALMIDDREDNIQGAAGAGLRGHVFVSPRALEVELVRAGLL